MKSLISLVLGAFLFHSLLFAGECQNSLSLLTKISNKGLWGKRASLVVSRHERNLVEKISKRVATKFDKLVEIQTAPNILMGATEFGALQIGKVNVVAKVGGLAVVVNDMLNNFLPFFKKRDINAKLSFGFMLYDGIPKVNLKKVNTYKFDMGRGFAEEVNVYFYKDASGSDIYFFDHPAFKKMSINGRGNVYELQKSEILYSGRFEWEEAFIYGLYNKALGKLQRDIKANIYHAHDQHASLAAIHVEENTAVSMTIHNAGPGYQGLYYTIGYGEHRPKVWSDLYKAHVPQGDFVGNDHLLKMLGVSYDQYIKYFEFDNGRFLTMKGALKYIEERNLIAGIPVSQGYKDELMTSKTQLVKNIMKEKGGPVTDESKLFIPNGGVELGFLDGIENGMALNNHAKNNPSLLPKTEEKLSLIHEMIVNNETRRKAGLSEIDPEVPRAWLKDLRFGHSFDSEIEIERVHKKKALLKSLLQKTADLDVDSSKPIFTIISRIVDQKNIDVFIENIKHVVRNGGQVVIGGMAGDETGEHAAKKMHKLMEDPELKGNFRFFDSFTNKELWSLIIGGGDAFIITSKFEPCGLTDIEAIHMANIPITRKVGGLGKVKNSFVYEWSDTSDPAGEVLALRKTLDSFLDVYKNDFERIKQMRINGLQEDFSWDKALTKYYENYQVGMLYQLVRQIAAEVKAGKIIQNEEFVEVIETIRRKLPVSVRNKFNDLLMKSTSSLESF